MRRKQFKKIVAGLCTAAMVVTGISWPGVTAKAEDTNTDLKLWYDEEAPDSYDGWEKWSLPIGNSGIGASIFGRVDRERIQLNEKSLWSGGPADDREYNGGNIKMVTYTNPYTSETVTTSMSDLVEVIQQLFKDNRDSEASSLCDKLVGVSDDDGNDGYGYYLSYGNMYLNFEYDSTSYENYIRTLDLRTAIAGVEYDIDGTHYTRESFVSYPDNVLVTQLTADQAKINVEIEVQPDNEMGGSTNTNMASDAYTRTWDTTVENNTISVQGELDDNQMKFVSHTKVIADGELVDNASTVSVSDAKTVTIITSIGTDYKNVYPNYRTGETDEAVSARVLQYVTDATAKTYDELKADHIADYDEIFGRVELDLGQVVSDKTTDALLSAYNSGSATDAEKSYLEVMLFQYGRYLTIQSSRETPDDDSSRETLPSNLQGIWVGANNSAWHSDYHMNVNLQMNYWPTYSTNMAECAEPLIAYVDSLREPGRVTAAIYAGVESTTENPENGFMAHTQNNPFGWTCPGWSFDWGWSPAAVPWILQNCWEYYEYTGNVDYMRNYIYPMLKEEAILYDQMLVEDAEGYLVSSPSYSPEHGPRTAGNTYEQVLIWQLYEDAIKAAELVGEEDTELVEGWKSNQANLKGPIEIGDSGQIKEWYEETTVNSGGGEGYDHRHISHMLGLFPGDLVQTNEEWIEAARVSMENRTDNSTGWAMGQRINTWARLGDGDKAYELIGNLFSGGILTNLWDTHAPFQIDGNFGYTSGVAEMLVQSNMGYVNLLPALPDAWADGSVEGLVARGNFEIGMTWAAKSLTEATILSNNGGTCIIEYPQIAEATVVDEAGNVVTATEVSENRISFETEQGKTYTIQEVPEKVVEAPENAKAVYSGNEALIIFDEVAKAEAYNVYESADDVTYKKVATITANRYYSYDFKAGKTYKLTAVSDSIESDKSATITPEEVVIIEKIDDRDARIEYSSGWGDWDQSSSGNGWYEGTEKYTSTVGATAEFYFYGCAVSVIGMKNTDCHTFDLYVDGELKADNVDTYNGTAAFHQELVKIDGLTDGIHEVKLVVEQGKISLDAFAFEMAEVLAAPEMTITKPVIGETLEDVTVEGGEAAVFEDVAKNPATLTTENLVIAETDGYQAFSGKITAANDGENNGKFNINDDNGATALLIRFKVNTAGVSLSGDSGLIGKMDNQYGIQYKDSKQIEFFANNGNSWPTVKSNAVDEGWHEVIAIYQPGTGYILYVDDAGYINVSNVALTENKNCAFTIGYNSTKPSNPAFTGQFTDVEMYTGDQVPTIVNSGNTVTTTKEEVVSALGDKTPMFKLNVKEGTTSGYTLTDTVWTNIGETEITTINDDTIACVVTASLTAEEGYKFAESSKPESVTIKNGETEEAVAPEKVIISEDGTTMTVSYRFVLNNPDGFEETDVPVSNISNITTGTHESVHASDYGDGDGAYVIDNNLGTKWHSEYTNVSEGQIDKFWIDFEMASLTKVDGIRVLPHTPNGQITKYEVWVSSVDEATWGTDYNKVCEGTWNNNSDGTSTWKTAKFEAVEAKHVRLVAVETKNNSGSETNKNVTIREIRLTVPTSEVTYAEFLGAGLRMDHGAAEYTKTSMRFGYVIPNIDGFTVDSWKWNWGIAEDALTGEVEGVNRINNEDGSRTSNLVVTDIPNKAYGTTVYSQLAVTYTTTATDHTADETLTVFTQVQERSVSQVADLINASTTATGAEKAYAAGIKEAMTQ